MFASLTVSEKRPHSDTCRLQWKAHASTCGCKLSSNMCLQGVQAGLGSTYNSCSCTIALWWNCLFRCTKRWPGRAIGYSSQACTHGSIIITQRDESLKEEESHLMKTFIGNGYPRAFVRSAFKQRTPREPDDNETERLPTFHMWQALVRGSGSCAGT